MAISLGQFALALDGTALPERTQIGGKAWSVARMQSLGLPVPPAVVITTDACRAYLEAGRFPDGLEADLDAAIAWLEQASGRTLGDGAQPLLVSVRSGAAISMPGMMDTVLNVGIDEAVARALADRGGEAFACGLYAQFLYDYAGTVLGLEGMQKPAPTWDAVAAFQAWLQEQGAPSFWTDAAPQLPLAVAAVFASWNSQRAVLFRRQAGIPQDGGTAVTVQQMVFGNADDDSCTGVVFTRDPTTGEDRLFGEYLPRSQGQDLVSGQRTPLPLLADPEQPGRSLQERHPPVLDRLRQVAALLEDHYRDMQDIEFTVQSGRLYLLQTRAGRRTPEAALRITADLAGIAAATSVPAARTTELSFRPLARGLGASPGRAAGRIALTCQSAEDQAARGHAVVLVRPSTAPEDLPGMVVAAAVLTRRGGATSHAANNARYMDKPCVVGCPDLVIDEAAGTLKIGEQLLREGDRIALDGGSGEVGVPQAADTR